MMLISVIAGFEGPIESIAIKPHNLLSLIECLIHRFYRRDGHYLRDVTEELLERAKHIDRVR